VRPASLLAVAASAVLGVSLGVGGGLVLDDGKQPPPTHGSTEDPGHAFSDPLSLGVPMVNQPCSGAFVLAIAKGQGTATLASALAANPRGRYLDTRKSCGITWQVSGKAAPRWVAYLGPYSSGSQACTVRMTAEHQATTVSQLKPGTTSPIRCLCYVRYTSMPTLHVGMTPSVTDVMWTYALQNLLIDMGRAEQSSATGVYDEATAAQVRRVQAERNLPTTGVVAGSTWLALQDHCRIYDEPSTNASP
jgi:peptidoglycan hydrolase-like protein with peptidoglycan-binding domain